MSIEIKVKNVLSYDFSTVNENFFFHFCNYRIHVQPKDFLTFSPNVLK